MAKYQSPYMKLKPPIRTPYTIIYLIRHCNPDYSTEKIVGDGHMPLSKIGLSQRRYLTKRLATMELDKLYASQMLRARQTGDPIAKKLGQELVVDERLNEIDWREWHRIKYFNMSEKSRVKKVSHYRAMETHLDKMQTFARRLLADVYKENKGKKVALFCHGNIIKTMLTSIVNADIIGFLSLEIYQSSISKLVIDRDGYIKINYINSICHLPHESNEDLFITLVD
jgi:alpha-ribazole phosphatase/probable phosphoglycerate mutase